MAYRVDFEELEELLVLAPRALYGKRNLQVLLEQMHSEMSLLSLDHQETRDDMSRLAALIDDTERQIEEWV